MLMITENVKGKPYKQLIDLVSKHCNRVAFVENRQMMEIEEERLAYIDNLMVDIKGHLLERGKFNENGKPQNFLGLQHTFFIFS